MAAHGRASLLTQCGITERRCALGIVRLRPATQCRLMMARGFLSPGTSPGTFISRSALPRATVAATDRGMSWQSAMPTVPVWLARHADRLRPFLIGTRCDWRGGRKTLAYYLPQQRWQAGR